MRFAGLQEEGRARRPEFWYAVYHTLFYLDLNLSGSTEGFASPEPAADERRRPALGRGGEGGGSSQ
jgi:hypothetical protein